MKKKYEGIIQYIEKILNENKLKPGDRLPSIRSLANQYECNKSTIIRAYKELEDRHMIYSIPKGGFYLVDWNSFEIQNHNRIDFSELMPDPKLLPYKEFNYCVNRAVEHYKNSLFTYSDPQGLESLRKTLVEHLEGYQVFTSHSNIFITSGAQQALSILTKMTFPNNKNKILVEQPTYGLIQKSAELNGIQLLGINRDNQGINLKDLEEIFKRERVKFFYTIPRYHNPLGTSYSEGTKKKIVELAAKYDVYIVEDDYLVDIEHNKKILPAFFYDVSERVIYVKSFSKGFLPGIRLGAVVLNGELREEFIKHKRCHDLSTSVLDQGALEIFINSGMYQKHIKKVQQEYRKKMNLLKESLRNWSIPRLEIYTPEIGLFVWIKLPKEKSINTLVKRLKDQNIYISPIEDFIFHHKSYNNGFRLCITKLTTSQIKIGLQRIYDELEKL